MAGNKNSGRKPLYVEARRLDVVDKAWRVTDQYLDSSDKLSNKVDKAIRIIGITTKQEVEHSGDLTLNMGHRAEES